MSNRGSFTLFVRLYIITHMMQELLTGKTLLV